MQSGTVKTPDAAVVRAVPPRERLKDGPVTFTRTTFTINGKTEQLAHARAPKELVALARTRNAPPSDGEAYPDVNDGFIVQGPAFGTPEAASKLPKGFYGWAQRVYVAFEFGRAHDWKNRLRLWGRIITDFQQIRGPEITAKIKEWGLQPGDWMITGGKHGGHLMMYAGADEQGRPNIIHSMASKYDEKSFREWVRVLAQLGCATLFGKRLDKTGVFQEPIAEFFERNAVGTVMAMRDPSLTPEMREHLMGLVRADIGKHYDGNLTEGTDRIYCSELLVKNLLATYDTFGAKRPDVLTCYVEQKPGSKLEMKAYVATPENVAVSPSFQFVGFAGTGAEDAAFNLRSIIHPPAV